MDMAKSQPKSDKVTLEASRVIDAPVERLWAEVADFNNIAAWHPAVMESHLEDTATYPAGNAGAIRVLKLRDGSIVRERLVSIDPSAHRYTYSVLDGQLPLKNHISSVAMRPLDAHRTEVTWSASFIPAGAPPNTLADGVRSGVLELGLQGLADRVRQAH
jgi:uncharacterized protein YndB with AHSA1/START domain